MKNLVKRTPEVTGNMPASFLPEPVVDLMNSLDQVSSGTIWRETPETPWLPPEEVFGSAQQAITPDNCAFFRVAEISFDDDFPRRESFENVLSALDNPAFNFVYLLSGTPSGIEIFIGVALNYSFSGENRLHASDVGDILEGSFAGNFQGSILAPLNKNDLERKVLEPLQRATRGSLITGVPSLNKNDGGQEIDFQGVDRLIASMSGSTWQLLIVCEPVAPEEIVVAKKQLFSLYDQLHVAAKNTVQVSKNWSSSLSETHGISDTNTRSKQKNDTKVNTIDNGDGDSTSYQTTQTKSIADAHGTSWSRQEETSTADGVSQTREVISKEIQNLLQYLDEELLERLKVGATKGMFNTAVYALAANFADYERMSRSIMSIFQGNRSRFSPLQSNAVFAGQDSLLAADKHKQLLGYFQIWHKDFSVYREAPLIYSHLIKKDGLLSISTLLTAQEISLIAGFPIKEAPGLPMREGVDFGLSVPVVNGSAKEVSIQLGNLIHRGRDLKVPVSVAKEDLNKHLFVTGVTGSGKTTTCQKLLVESNLPFWVIEPAKTEYRTLLDAIPREKMAIFTLGNENLAPFRFNPFELIPGESLTSHVDMLKATFCAAFPMEAAMPYILEEAVYLAYQKYGWNTDGWSTPDEANVFCQDPWSAHGRYWPTVTDLLICLKEVVKRKNFDARLAADYQASLISRISNWTVGSKGLMLNTKLSVGFEQLLDKMVVLELEELRDPQDKALMMGLIVARLAEAVKLRHKNDPSFRCLVLVEEAHRLLEKSHPGEGSSRKHAVSMFTDLLAEVRKYGMGIIIADQIPNKLTPEVLKNTNIKIVHQLFAKDDREIVGDTMGMDESQKDFLPKLLPGETILFCGGWNKPVRAKIAKTDTGEMRLWDEEMAQFGKIQIFNMQQSFFPELGLCNLTLPTAEQTEKHRQRVKMISASISRVLRNVTSSVSGKSNDLTELLIGDEVFQQQRKFYSFEHSGDLVKILSEKFVLDMGFEALSNAGEYSEDWCKFLTAIWCDNGNLSKKTVEAYHFLNVVRIRTQI